MKEVKSDKLTFWEFLKKDWVGEYFKRICEIKFGSNCLQ